MCNDHNAARHHTKFALRAALRKARRPSRYATQRRAFVQRRTKKENHAATSNETSRTRIHRLNASDVRYEGGVAACALGVEGSWQPSAAGARRRAGVVFFPVGRGQALPPSAWLSPRHFSPSRFLSCVPFLRHAVGSWAAGVLRCVTWPRGQGAWHQTRRLKADSHHN